MAQRAPEGKVEKEGNPGTLAGDRAPVAPAENSPGILVDHAWGHPGPVEGLLAPPPVDGEPFGHPASAHLVG